MENIYMNLDPALLDKEIKGIEIPKQYRTASNKLLDFEFISESDLDIDSAANGLATVQRWGGQANNRITVAEHSLAVCSILPDQFKFDGLMHDISEGILGIDAAKPIKNMLPDFQNLEDKIMRLAAKKWGFRYPLPAIVKEADIKVTKFEWKYNILQTRNATQIPSDDFLKKEFLDAFYLLQKDRSIKINHYFSNNKSDEMRNNYQALTAEAARLKSEISVMDYFLSLEKRGVLRYEGKNGKECFFGWEEQKTGSIAINENKNLWHDHSTGEGGDLIKAVQFFEKKTFVEAIKALSNNSDLFSAVRTKGLLKSKKEKDYSIIKVQDTVTHPALLRYLTSKRGLDVSDFSGILKEIHWTVEDKENQEQKRFFGVAVQNQNGGYAVRSEIWKGNLKETGISVYTIGKNPERVKVFEGIMDFGSYQKLEPGKSYLAVILNSTANLTKETVEVIKSKVDSVPSRECDIYLDNDEGGIDGTKKILNAIPGAVDKSSFYASEGYNDLNDYLLNNYLKSINQIPQR